MSTLLLRSRTFLRLRRMGWTSLGLSVVLYLAGSNIGSGWIVMLAAALLTAPLLDMMTAWSVHRRTTVDARLSGPSRVGASRLTLRIKRPQGLTALRVSSGSTSARGVVRRPRAQIEGPIDLLRGVHRQVEVDGETVGSLGLAFARSTWCHETNVVVAPATLPCPARVRRLIGRIDDDEHRRRARRDDEIQGVRPFVQGDPQRHVNWRATARHGELMVREHTRNGGGGTIQVTMSDGLWDHDAMDLACTVVASVAVQAVLDGHQVTLGLDGRSIDWTESTAATLATLPPAHGIDARPLIVAPGTRAVASLQLSCSNGAVLAVSPNEASVHLGDLEAVSAWLQA